MLPPTPLIDVTRPSPTICAPSNNNFESDCQPYDDIPLSHQDPPAAALAQSSDTFPPLLQQSPAQNPSFHRRANTEIITRRRLEESARRLSGWFQGKSEPLNVGVVNQENTAPAMERRSSSQDSYGSPTTPTMNRKRMTAPSPLKQVTSTSPLSFFGLKRPARDSLPEPAEDEFLNLDITAALFPPGSTNLDDHEAFQSLRNNADNVLRRLQAAYKQRTFALHEALLDKNEKQEELEETRTRVGHLKIQLDGMAEKVQQQEHAMNVLAEELEQERQLRRRDDEARRRSTMLTRSSDDESSSSDLGADLQAPKRSLNRNSNATFTTSDSGFESGDESVADSVFSSSRRDGVESPSSTTAPSIASSSPSISQVALSAPLPTTPSHTTPSHQKELKPPASTTPRQSAYDRVMKGLASTGIASSWGGNGNSSKCTICYGVPASEAWSVMGILKEENKGLKGRLGELEMVIDDCLSVVGP